MTLRNVVIFISIIVFLPTSKAADRCLSRTAVGLESGKIPDYAMTSSSNPRCCSYYCRSCHEAKSGRLHGLDLWRPLSYIDPNRWIQIDLGSSVTVTKVATQGRKADYVQWVTSYVLTSSQDGSSFQPYNNGEVIKANSDQDTVVGHVLQPPITARYIKLHPKTFHGNPSMRMELYTGQCSAVNYYMAGQYEACDQACKSRDQICLDIDHGLTLTNITKLIIESLIGQACKTGYKKSDTYSYGSHPAYMNDSTHLWYERCVGWENVPEKIDCARLPSHGGSRRLCPCNKVKHARVCQNTGGYLQCMNGRAIKVVNANFGRTEYDVCPHVSIKSTDCRDGLSLRIVSDKCQGKSYCDVWSSTETMGSDPCPNTQKYLQVEYQCAGAVKQAFVRTDSCSGPLGLEGGTIPDSDITASSSYSADHGPHYGRLNSIVSARAWCALTNDPKQYFQVDFRKHRNVTKVSTQGRQIMDEWVKSFSLSYSRNNITYLNYKQSGQEVVFSGNTDRNTIVSHNLNPPIVARNIRIHPKTWHNHICLRAEFNGCKTKPTCVTQYCDNCKRSAPFRKTRSGALLSGHVIGKFLASDEIVCQLYCLRNPYCVSFNLGPPRGPLRECEISDSDHLQNPKDIVSREGYEYYGMENACSSGPCPNNASCQADFDKNTFRCVCPPGFTGKFCEEDMDECFTHIHDCDPSANCTNTAGSYNCTCHEGYISNGKTCYVPETCTDILEYNSSAQSGSYYLKRKGGDPQLVYCHMEELPGCSGRGWTMVMKINGTKSTFSFSSPHWSDNSPVNAEAGSKSLEVREETKVHTYWSTPLTRLCLGMSWSGATKWLEIKQSSSSLLQVLAGSPALIPTTVGRAAWKSLLKGSSLQKNCNREGFNAQADYATPVRAEKVKIGILENDDLDCYTVNSYLGFGAPASGCRNLADVYHSPDNGEVDIKPFCYILLK